MLREQSADRVIGAIDSWLRSEPHEPPVFDAEDRKERDWCDLENAAKDFVRTYGAAAMVRCISEALKP
jgi:hypothetical protein